MINYKLMVLIFVFAIFSKDEKNEAYIPSLKMKTAYVSSKEVADGQIEDGKAVYMKYCMSCHQIDGSGVPGMFPPLRKSDWVIGDKKRLISGMLNGIQGEIEVNGQIYRQAMPKQDYLTDEQLAKVLTFVRQNLGNKAGIIAAKDVANLRPKRKK